MSIELHVFLTEQRAADRDAWQHAIEQLGFPTVLEPSFDPRSDTGFSPTTYKGRPTGFEYYLEPAADLLAAYSHIKSRVGNRDKCATFRWGGDLRECAAALSAAATFTVLTDGIYY